MEWTDRSYMNPRVRKPEVLEWLVGRDANGDPIVLLPKGTIFKVPEGNRPAMQARGIPVEDVVGVDVPYRDPTQGEGQHDTIVPTQIPISKREGDRAWNGARQALLDLFVEFPTSVL